MNFVLFKLVFCELLKLLLLFIYAHINIYKLSMETLLRVPEGILLTYLSSATL